MTTVINTPPNQSNDDGFGVGLIAGIMILAVILTILFFMYGLPMLGNENGKQTETQNIEIQVPTTQAPVTTPEPTE